jgi:hypothetical protein
MNELFSITLWQRKMCNITTGCWYYPSLPCFPPISHFPTVRINLSSITCTSSLQMALLSNILYKTRSESVNPAIATTICHYIPKMQWIYHKLRSINRTAFCSIYSQKYSVALSPQANYTDWATANCRWNLVPTFVDRRVSLGQLSGSLTVVNFSFLGRRSRYFFFQAAPHLYSRAWVDPVPDPLLLIKFGSAGNRTQDLWIRSQEIWPLDHRGGPIYS